MTSIYHNQPTSQTYQDLGGQGGRQARAAGRNRRQAINATLHRCGQYGSTYECEKKHLVVMRLHCSYEWCPDCGKKGSRVHKQRIARQLVNVLNMEDVGYFVFTIPIELRRWFDGRDALRDARRAIICMVRYKLGEGTDYLIRWHFFGDKSKEYNPHLNMLVNSAWCDPGVLDDIKFLWREWLRNYTGESLNKIDVQYQYASGYQKRSLKRKYHWVDYIMRATATADKVDDNFKMRFYNFRNVCASKGWAELKKQGVVPEVHEFLEGLKAWKKMKGLVDFDMSKCPVCGSALKHLPPIMNYGGHWDKCQDLGSGLYLVPEDVYNRISVQGIRGP